MPRALVLAIAVTMMSTSAALAAALTESDYRYLGEEYGLALDGETIRDLTVDEQAKLHDLINDPALKASPYTRDQNVADFLFAAHMRECSVWALSHGGPQCPPSSDASAEPGKEIADRQCNACHLFGTPAAPSFFKLAREGKPNQQALADVLDHGHTMSPITLTPAELQELIVYIRSLK